MDPERSESRTVVKEISDPVRIPERYPDRERHEIYAGKRRFFKHNGRGWFFYDPEINKDLFGKPDESVLIIHGYDGDGECYRIHLNDGVGPGIKLIHPFPNKEDASDFLDSMNVKDPSELTNRIVKVYFHRKLEIGLDVYK